MQQLNLKGDHVVGEEIKTMGVAVLYALAATFGMVGGCAVGTHQVFVGHMRLSFVFAYAIIGAVSAIGFMAITSIFKVMVVTTIHEHILYSMLVGGAVALTLFSANATVRIIFKKLGIEVQITTRKRGAERRSETKIEV